MIKKYYSDKYRTKQTKEEKGKYLEIITKLNDSVSMSEFVNLKTKITLWKISYYKNHPYGLCTYYKENGEIDYELNYDFFLKYGDLKPDSFLEIDYESQKLKNKINSEFEMPVLKNYTSFKKYIGSNLTYPQVAAENNIQGTVYVMCSINKLGKIKIISIVKGVDDSLDWEACNVINSAPILVPARLNGKNIDTFMIIPVVFRLV